MAWICRFRFSVKCGAEMIFYVALVAALFWFAFVAILLYAKSSPEAQVRRRIMLMIESAENLRLSTTSTKPPTAELPSAFSDQSFFYRVLKPLMNKISENIQEFAPTQIQALFEKLIFIAGKQGIWSVKRLVFMWLVSIGIGLSLGILISRQVEYHFLQETMILIFGSACGAIFPFFRLHAKIRARKRQMRRQLPEFLDLLCVSVQAGLSFDGAVSKIVTRMKGDLISEFLRVQSDMALGMTRAYALTQMAKRCDLEEIYLFTSSVIQAERLGTSMARTLKLQSDNIRDRHRQYVKAQALKAPVKIIFPMVLFIFPSIFVVLLLPAVLTIIKTLGDQ